MSGMTRVHLSRGYTMLTPQTKRWTPQQWAMNNDIEKMMLFVNQQEEDLGRSRVLVARFDDERRLQVYARKINTAKPEAYSVIVQWINSQPETNKFTGWEMAFNLADRRVAGGAAASSGKHKGGES